MGTPADLILIPHKCWSWQVQHPGSRFRIPRFIEGAKVTWQTTMPLCVMLEWVRAVRSERSVCNTESLDKWRNICYHVRHSLACPTLGSWGIGLACTQVKDRQWQDHMFAAVHLLFMACLASNEGRGKWSVKCLPKCASKVFSSGNIAAGEVCMPPPPWWKGDARHDSIYWQINELVPNLLVMFFIFVVV